jgi:predicted nuclease of predicted toxin-antitoxin system
LSVGFYIDENVPLAVVLGLRLRGIDVVTVYEDHRDSRPDEEVLDRATELGRVVVTRDEDFLVEAHIRQRSGRMFPGVVYAHQLWVTIGQMIDDLVLIAGASLVGELENRVEYLPLRR